MLVPLYNTPEKFLREMIESVQAQTYKNWELCLADGSDDKHQDVGEICLDYQKRIWEFPEIPMYAFPWQRVISLDFLTMMM